jgi:hypothetical protein
MMPPMNEIVPVIVPLKEEQAIYGMQGAAVAAGQATDDPSAITAQPDKPNDVMPMQIEVAAKAEVSQTGKKEETCFAVGVPHAVIDQTADLTARIKRVATLSGICAEKSMARLSRQLDTDNLSAPQLAVVSGIMADKLLQSSKVQQSAQEPMWAAADLPE